MPRRRSRAASGKRFLAHEEQVNDDKLRLKLHEILELCDCGEHTDRLVKMLVSVVETERESASLLEGDTRNKAVEMAADAHAKLVEKTNDLTKAQSIIKSLTKSVQDVQLRAEAAEEELEGFKGQCEGLQELVKTLLDGVDQSVYGDVTPMKAATMYIADLKKALVELDAKVNELVGCQAQLKVCADTTGFVKQELNNQLKAIAKAEDAANSGWLPKWFSESKQ